MRKTNSPKPINPNKSLKPLNERAQAFVDTEMIPFFERKAIQSLTPRTQQFWEACIETLKAKPQHFMSIITNRYKSTDDFTIQRATVLEWGKRLQSIQMKKWSPEE